MNILQSKLMIVPITIGVALLAWWGLTATPADEALIVSQTVQSGEERQLAEVLASLNKVNLEGEIFSNPLFANLQDFSTTIVEEPAGRLDPFAPISGEAQIAPQDARIQEMPFSGGNNRPTIPRSELTPRARPQ